MVMKEAGCVTEAVPPCDTGKEACSCSLSMYVAGKSEKLLNFLNFSSSMYVYGWKMSQRW